MQKLVSVIIPVYNRQDTIARALDSVLGQTYQNIEVIIVDDGSDDNTMAVLNSYSDSRIRIFSQNHKGACAARNRGINEAKGFYIAFQDSDDEWMPDKLSKQISYMEANHFKVCYCPHELHDNGIHIIPSDYLLKEKYEEYIEKTLKSGNVISTQTLVLEKNVFDRVGKFDIEMPRLQDYELVIRIAPQYKIGYCAEVLVKVYRQKISIDRDNGAKKEAIYQLLKKHRDFLDHDYIHKLFLMAMDALEEEDTDYLIGLQKLSGISMEEFAETVIRFIHKKYLVLFPLFKLQQQLQYDQFERGLRTDGFAIYGAGKVAKKVVGILMKKNLKPRCFLVSEPPETKRYIQGIPVESPEAGYRDMPVLIAVGIEKQRDIISHLHQEGFMNFCAYPLYELD